MKYLILVLALFAASAAALNNQQKQLLMKLNKNFWSNLLDSIVNGAVELTDSVLLPAITESLQGLAGLAAQLTAGLAVGGLDALVGLISRRQNVDIALARNWLTDLLDAIIDIGVDLTDTVLLPAITESLQGLAGLAAQLTAGLAVGGLDALVGLISRHHGADRVAAAKFLGGLLDLLVELGQEVLLPILNETLQDVAGLAAQLTAGLAVGGLDALVGLLGKTVSKNDIAALLAIVHELVGSHAELLSSIGGIELFALLQAALASGDLNAILGLLGQKNFLDFLAGLGNVVLDAVTLSLQDLAGIAAQLTAGLAVGGLDAIVGLLGA